VALLLCHGRAGTCAIFALRRRCYTLAARAKPLASTPPPIG